VDPDNHRESSKSITFERHRPCIISKHTFSPNPKIKTPSQNRFAQTREHRREPRSDHHRHQLQTRYLPATRTPDLYTCPHHQQLPPSNITSSTSSILAINPLHPKHHHPNHPPPKISAISATTAAPSQSHHQEDKAGPRRGDQEDNMIAVAEVAEEGKCEFWEMSKTDLKYCCG
jgi:hypothetical protein